MTGRLATYRSDIEAREERGTPDILGAVRLGLVFKMEQVLGSAEVLPFKSLVVRWSQDTIYSQKTEVDFRQLHADALRLPHMFELTGAGVCH